MDTLGPVTPSRPFDITTVRYRDRLMTQSWPSAYWHATGFSPSTLHSYEVLIASRLCGRGKLSCEGNRSRLHDCDVLKSRRLTGGGDDQLLRQARRLELSWQLGSRLAARGARRGAYTSHRFPQQRITVPAA